MLQFVILKKKHFKMCLKDKKYRIVRDHCHYTGEYRGVGHSIWNLK